jgi:hypothetical protein
MNILHKTLIASFLAGVLLASCSSFQSTPTVSDTEIMETAMATVSTALAETQPALPTATATTSRAPSKIGGYWQFSI